MESPNYFNQKVKPKDPLPNSPIATNGPWDHGIIVGTWHSPPAIFLAPSIHEAGGKEELHTPADSGADSSARGSSPHIHPYDKITRQRFTLPASSLHLTSLPPTRHGQTARSLLHRCMLKSMPPQTGEGRDAPSCQEPLARNLVLKDAPQLVHLVCLPFSQALPLLYIGPWPKNRKRLLRLLFKHVKGGRPSSATSPNFRG